jgi:carbon monoxide dehydrogenase subunit G
MSRPSIRISRSFELDQPLEEVWSFLRDPDKLASCIPGVEEVEALDERTFRAVMGVSLAQFRPRFTVRLVITEETPPHHLAAQMAGDDSSLASGLEITNTVDLRALEGSRTEVAYAIEGRLKGKLAALGGGIAVKLKARQMAREFAETVRRHIEGAA